MTSRKYMEFVGDKPPSTVSARRERDRFVLGVEFQYGIQPAGWEGESAIEVHYEIIPPEQLPAPRYLTVDEAVDAFGVSRSRIYKLCKSGRITSRRKGTRLLIYEHSLRTFLEETSRRKREAKAKRSRLHKPTS